MSKKYHGPKWLAWVTLLSVIGGIAMTMVGSFNGINGLVTAGLVVAFGLTMVLNVGTAIIMVIKEVIEDDQTKPASRSTKNTTANKMGCVIGISILVLFISVPLVATFFFSTGQEAIGGAIIGSMFAAVILVIIITNIRQKAKNGYSSTNDNSSDAAKEKSSFDQYMEADDAFEKFIDGVAYIYLNDDESEKIRDESNRAYDEYILNCDKYGGEGAGELLYAQKIYEIIHKYKLIIKSRNPEYDIGDDDNAEKEKSSFDQYMEADDAFEEFIDGDADIYLDADEYEKVIDEGDKAYDEYMIDCDKHGGESQGEILYAKKLHEIIRKYKLIIKSRNPEYEIGESLDDINGKRQMVATLVDALKQVAKKKEKAEHKKIGMEIIEREKARLEIKEKANLEKPDYSVFGISPKKEKSKSSLELADILQRVADQKEKAESEEISAKNPEFLNFDSPKIEKTQISPKKPSYAQPDYSVKSEETPTEEKAEKVKKSVENISEQKQENTAAPKRATIAYKGIKKK